MVYLSRFELIYLRIKNIILTYINNNNNNINCENYKTLFMMS